MTNWKNLIVAAICIAIPMATGGLAGYITSDDSSGVWYQALAKPAFQPPGWVFGPVWTTLYFLMGVGLFLVWRAPASRARTAAMGLFGGQLVLNFFWSLIFFQWHLLGVAVAEIVLMWVAIVAMMVAFWRVRPVAAYLQIPYIAWVTFATVLTSAIYWLNRG